MTNREYAIKSFKEVTVQMMSQTEAKLDCHTEDMKRLLTYYSKLVIENKLVLEELEQECQEKINADMAYALQYLNQYDYRLNVGKLKGEINNIMMIYGLSDMIYRALILLQYYTPKGPMHSEIIRACYCSQVKKDNIELQIELGISRSLFYKEKKQALRWMGYFFYEVVVAQASSGRYKPSFDMSEE